MRLRNLSRERRQRQLHGGRGVLYLPIACVEGFCLAAQGKGGREGIYYLLLLLLKTGFFVDREQEKKRHFFNIGQT